jgi:CheY-like chemotaxis protein
LIPPRTPRAFSSRPADAFAVERILASSRYQAIATRSVAEARRALQHLQPAAAILDVVLLGDESWRFLIELKQGVIAGNIPVLVASSSPDERKAINLGADEFMAKPADPEKLLRMLDRLTGYNSVTRVLVVDDEEVSRYLVRQLLPRGTYDVREAATGIEGLAQLRDEPPDVVLLDLNMAGMDGFQFLDQLDRHGNIPTVVLTSMIIGKDERPRLQKAAKVISKSDLSSELLVQTIDDVLGIDAERVS